MNTLYKIMTMLTKLGNSDDKMISDHTTRILHTSVESSVQSSVHYVHSSVNSSLFGHFMPFLAALPRVFKEITHQDIFYPFLFTKGLRHLLFSHILLTSLCISRLVSLPYLTYQPS